MLTVEEACTIAINYDLNWGNTDPAVRYVRSDDTTYLVCVVSNCDCFLPACLMKVDKTSGKTQHCRMLDTPQSFEWIDYFKQKTQHEVPEKYKQKRFPLEEMHKALLAVSVPSEV